MDEKENNRKEDEKIDKGSNSCVMDLSIDGGNGEEEAENNAKIEKKEKNEIDSTSSLNKSFDDFLNFTKKLNLIDNFENILDYGGAEEEEKKEGNINDAHIIENRKNRSKTFKIKKSNNLMAPKPQLIAIDEYIKPLKLDSSKSIVRENSQNELIECKSCEDKSEGRKNYNNYFNNDDSEEEIINTLQINEIKNETKKVSLDSKINCKYYNEFENILNIEKIFWKNVNNDNYNDILIGKNRCFQNTKKRIFWQKHISCYKKQMDSMKKSEESNAKNEFRKRSDTFSKKSNNEGLFILGVLESAAKAKKRRRTMHIKRLSKHYQEEDKK